MAHTTAAPATKATVLVVDRKPYPRDDPARRLRIPVPEFVRAWRVDRPRAFEASGSFYLARRFPNSSQACRAGDAAEMSSARIAGGSLCRSICHRNHRPSGPRPACIGTQPGFRAFYQLWGTQRRSHHHGYFRQRRPERQRYAARARLSKRRSEQGSGVDCRYCHCCCDHRCVCVRIRQFGAATALPRKPTTWRQRPHRR